MNIIFKNNETLFVEKEFILASNYLKNVYEEFPEEDFHLDVLKDDFLEIIKLLSFIKDEQIDYQLLKGQTIKKKHILKEPRFLL